MNLLDSASPENTTLTNYLQQLQPVELNVENVEGQLTHFMEIVDKQNSVVDEDCELRDGKVVKKIRYLTPKQQALNKQAQQRYRQRKRDKAIQLEKEVEDLGKEVYNLKDIRKQRDDLEQKMIQLTNALQQKELEVKSLQTELNSLKVANVSNVQVASSDDLAIQSVLDKEKQVEIIADQSTQKFNSLCVFLNSQGLANGVDVSPDEEQYDQETIKTLRQLVNDMSVLCLCSLQTDEFDILEVMSNHMAIPGDADSEGQEQQVIKIQKWHRIVKNLKLNQQQVQRLQKLQEEVAEKLNLVYQIRLELNKRAISCLLPKTSNQPVGFLQKECNKSKMGELLAKLRETITAEHKIVTELDKKVFTEVLTALQGAWFIVACYPEHCYCMNLLSTIKQL
eukprot:TRINITY_DN35034_c0_g1_i1.p1 TRINITY_DN35034_c0_g1~~TRINITY_DN35034_c0_g1_i1.p1  ORF type:complete len:459 (-),score=43.66 TRINITY_DN35034_c0_g1_i1:260-1444(-)